MNSCRKIDLDFFERAPVRYEAVVQVRATPEKIFDIFEDARAWTQWALPITRVDWTSPKPFGIGTTRTVTMSGGMVGEEEFCAWEYGKRMAFYFTRSNIPNVAAFGEDYHVRDLGDGRCEVKWVMAMDPTGFNKVIMPVTGPLMKFGLQFMLGSFRKYVEAQPDRAPVPQATPDMA